jgi:phosphoribosylformylglycinamidine cyclo-ligase
MGGIKQKRMSEHTGRIDYKSAGVDIEAGNEAVRRMKAHVTRTHSSAVLTGLGSFGSMFALGDALKGIADPVMVQSTDGVGTKTKVTVLAGRYEELGRDLVAAVAGDIAVMGARPLTFLDYLGVHKVEPEIVEQIVKGMSAACAEAGIALVGGETAEMPAVYAPGELDVVGFVTGVVDRAKLITGETIAAGDVVYAINSSGLHTNGWSLARKLLFDVAGHSVNDRLPELNNESLADVLLAPHTNYVMPIRRILDAGVPVKGMAHITGGGVIENIPRILPQGLGVTVDRSTWAPQPIFTYLQQLGKLDAEEMHRVFNMGVGLVLIAPAGLQSHLAALLEQWPYLRVWELGRVIAGREGTQLVGGA